MVVLDQITKYLAGNTVAPYETIAVLPVLNLVSVRNEGAAFGMMSSLGNVFFVVVTLVAIAFVLYLLAKGKDGSLGLSLILAGAAGNLIDRMALGYVRDFVDVHAGTLHWPAFNVADSALTVGVAVMLIGALVAWNKTPAG